MKQIIFTLMTLVVSFNTFAKGQGGQIRADFSVHYYEDHMPGILPVEPVDPVVSPRVHYYVSAKVNFCRTVTSQDFELEVVELDGVNYLSLHADGLIIDCFGPTREQVLTYKFDKDVDTNLPFAQIKPVQKIFEGKVF